MRRLVVMGLATPGWAAFLSEEMDPQLWIYINSTLG